MTDIEPPEQSPAQPHPEAGPAISAAEMEEVRRTGHNPLPVRALQIETSSICNFRCASCALSLADYDRPEKHMTPAQFERILAAFPDVEKVELQGVGEVFLNPEVLDIVRAASDRGVSVHTFSNASRITRPLAFDIVRSGLELINFSMDGADEETFRRLRKGGTLARYKRCVTNLLQARAALGSATPKIGVMSVLSKANKDQVPQLLAIAEELGVDHLIFTKLNSGPKPDQEPLLLTETDREELLGLPDYDGPVELVWAITPWSKAERMDCYWPKSMTYVTVEGDVTPCCNYFDSRELKLGNAFEQEGAEIWNGQAYRDFWRQLLSGHLPHHRQVC